MFIYIDTFHIYAFSSVLIDLTIKQLCDHSMPLWLLVSIKNVMLSDDVTTTCFVVVADSQKGN